MDDQSENEGGHADECQDGDTVEVEDQNKDDNEDEDVEEGGAHGEDASDDDDDHEYVYYLCYAKPLSVGDRPADPVILESTDDVYFYCDLEKLAQTSGFFNNLLSMKPVTKSAEHTDAPPAEPVIAIPQNSSRSKILPNMCWIDRGTPFHSIIPMKTSPSFAPCTPVMSW